MRVHVRLASLFLYASAATALPAAAATINWNATATSPSPGTDWASATNWVGGVVPGTNDVANFYRWDRLRKPDIGANGYAVGGITFDNFGGLNGKWNLNGTGVLTVGPAGFSVEQGDSIFFPTVNLVTNTTWLGRSAKVLVRPMTGTGIVSVVAGSLYYSNNLANPTFRGGVVCTYQGGANGGEIGSLLWAPYSFTADGTYRFGNDVTGTGAATLTVSGGGVTVAAFPSVAATNNVLWALENPIAVGPFRGGLYGQQWRVGSVDSMIRFSGPIDLGGLLRTGDQTASTRGNNIRYTGTISIRQSAPALAGLTQFVWGQNSEFRGTVVDGAGPYANPLVLTTHQLEPWLMGGTNTYAHGTRVDLCGMLQTTAPDRSGNGFVIAAGTTLGTGDVEVGPGGLLKLRSAGAVAAGATLTVRADSLTLGVASIGDNALPSIGAGSAGVLGIDTAGFDQVSDLSALGGGAMFLGSTGAGVFTGTALAAGSGNLYRLGGGYGTLRIANGVLLGTAGLRVGSIAYHGNGSVLLSAANPFSGAIEVRSPVAHHLGTTLRGEAVTNVTESAFGSPTAPVRLYGSTLRLDGNVAAAPAVKGALTVDSESVVYADRDGSAANNAHLRFDSLVRTNGAILVVQGDESYLGLNERVLLNTPPPTASGIAPPWIVAKNQASDAIADFAAYDAAAGFRTNGVYTSLSLETSGAGDVVKYAGAITGPREAYALKATGDITGTGQKITLHGGGLILQGGNNDIVPDIDFGAAEGVIYVADSNPWELKGRITGSGGITKGGMDVVELDNATNTFSGPITVNRGELRAFFDDLTTGTAASLGNTNNPIVLNGGRLTVTDTATGKGLLASRTVTLGPLGGGFLISGPANRTITFAGRITGPGPLIQESVANNVTFQFANGGNDYAGGTYVFSASPFRVSPTGKLGTGPVLVMRGSQVRLEGNGNIDRGARLTAGIEGDVYFECNAPVIGSLDGSGTVWLGLPFPSFQKPDTNCVLTVGTDDTDSTFHGLIREPGTGFGFSYVSHAVGSLTKVGAGTFTVTGPQFYTGQTTVSNGTFCLSGSVLSNVVVEASGTLVGSGAIGGDLAVNGGRLAVELRAEMKPLDVAGAASFATGSALAVTVADGFAPGSQSFTILSAAGGLSGASNLTTTEGFVLRRSGNDLVVLRRPSTLLIVR